MTAQTLDAVIELAAATDLINRHPDEFTELVEKRREQLAPRIGMQRSVKESVKSARATSTRGSHRNTPVLDSNGRELEKGQRVATPRGEVATVVRFNRSQKRVVVEYHSGEMRMVTGTRLTIIE